MDGSWFDNRHEGFGKDGPRASRKTGDLKVGTGFEFPIHSPAFDKRAICLNGQRARLWFKTSDGLCSNLILYQRPVANSPLAVFDTRRVIDPVQASIYQKLSASPRLAAFDTRRVIDPVQISVYQKLSASHGLAISGTRSEKGHLNLWSLEWPSRR